CPTTDNNDRYFVGFPPYYVAAVWTGYDTPATMYFSNNPAVTIWKSVMERVHEGLDYRSFPEPVIGSPTNIFDVTEEEPDDTEQGADDVEASAEPSPEPTDAPEETERPDGTEEEPSAGGEDSAPEPDPSGGGTDDPEAPETTEREE
ncbi:MAG: hypothetical protein LUB58_01635, partial [Oscillospiraceae bacterium]|nr:hypothetical protein [Oscillospiraceae bacterium]